jgi:MFS family permease
MPGMHGEACAEDAGGAPRARTARDGADREDDIPLSAVLGRVLLPFGLGYFLSFLYRTVNGAVGPDLTAELKLDPADLGFLTSVYFISFAAFQLPLGVLLDRYGPRRVESSLLLLSAAGAVLFALAEGLPGLAAGRLLIGLGVSAGLMGAMKANLIWWPPERLALANGLILAMGGLGAVAATAPTEALLPLVGWRGLFLGLAGLSLLIAAVLRLVAPEPPAPARRESWRDAARGAAAVFRHPLFLAVAPWCALSHGTFLAYHGLWAAAWLRDVEGLDRATVQASLAIGSVGFILGTFASGITADRLARRGVPTLAVAVGGVFLTLGVESAMALGVPLPPTLGFAAFFFFAMFATLCFAALASSFPRELGGRVNTALNLTVFVVAFALQWAIGAALARLGPEIGTAAAHRLILGALVVGQLLLLALGAATALSARRTGRAVIAKTSAFAKEGRPSAEP